MPALESALGDADPPQPRPGPPVDGARDPAVENARDRLLRDAALAGGVRDCRVDQHAPGPGLVCLGVGAAWLVPRARWRRRRVARTVWASRLFGPNLDEDRTIEQGQMAKVHGGIPPVNVATLPTAAATLGPFEGALNADEPVPLRCLLRREDAHVRPVQRHLNTGVQSASHSEPVPPSSHLNRVRIRRYLAAYHGSSGRAGIFSGALPVALPSGEAGEYTGTQWRRYEDALIRLSSFT